MKNLLWAIVFASFGCATTNAPPHSRLMIAVDREPPPPKNEAKPDVGCSEHLWADGYWDYLAGQYIWHSGQWVPANPGYDLVQARYRQHEGEWTLELPHWKKAEILNRLDAVAAH